MTDGPGATNEWKFVWERFSSGMIYRKQMLLGDPSRPLIMAWCIGKLTDNNLNGRFEQSGSVFVAMQTVLTTRFVDSAPRSVTSGSRTVRNSVLKAQTVEQQLSDGQKIEYT